MRDILLNAFELFFHNQLMTEMYRIYTCADASWDSNDNKF